MSRRRNKLPADPVPATIESLSHEGRGITHINGKTIFIDGALAGETVLFRYTRQRGKFDEGVMLEVLQAADQRIEPPCEHFDICGGCSLQHMTPAFQIKHKENVLLEQLYHSGGIEPQSILPPLTGPITGYRHKARLGVRHVPKKNKVLVGFREKRSSFLADLERCVVLHQPAGSLITPLKQLISKLSVYQHIPQIEIAVGEQATALVLRELQDHTEDDLAKLREFENQYGVDIYTQRAGPQSIIPVSAGKVGALSYQLPEFGIEILFSPVDFTQINFAMNRKMVRRVIDLLDIQTDENVLDLFCGLGNFTLCLARQAGQVTGVEGSDDLVDKARINARHNKINNVEFIACNLTQEEIYSTFMTHTYQKVLLDPPRTGAREIIEQMSTDNIAGLVYVSCNPATLARDAGILVHKKGFQLKSAGVMDMFPHTAHVESIAVFEHN